MNTLHFKMTGMHCEACFKVITLKVKAINGVTDFVLAENGDATLTSERAVTLEEVREALQGTEYIVSAV
jgi:copper chaperone CopZ